MLDFFAAQSPLANLFTIITGAIALVSMGVAFGKNTRSWVKNLLMPEDFSKLIIRQRLDQLPDESLRKVARIAVIDDHLEDIPLDELRAYGFSVDAYTSISLSESERFKVYDIIFLDINGVVKEDLEFGGGEAFTFSSA